MRILFSLILLLSSAPLALAQGYSSAPIVVVGGETEPEYYPHVTAQLPLNFSKTAVTSIGENIGGEEIKTPANPPSPATPVNPAASATPPSPTSPASPATPANPVNKLWPRDTAPIFMTACVGFSPQKIPPCSCVITKLMLSMGHDEFLAKSENGSIEQDQRLQRIRMDCATAPQKKE